MSWERAAMAAIAEMLGAPPEVTITTRPATPLSPSEHLRSMVVSFVGQAVAPAERQTVLAAATNALAPNGRLVVIDHNRPRRLPAALAALVGRPAVPGWTPRARWQRLAYPVAREAACAGLVVEALRLVAGERVQLVFTRRRAAPETSAGVS